MKVLNGLKWKNNSYSEFHIIKKNNLWKVRFFIILTLTFAFFFVFLNYWNIFYCFTYPYTYLLFFSCSLINQILLLYLYALTHVCQSLPKICYNFITVLPTVFQRPWQTKKISIIYLILETNQNNNVVLIVLYYIRKIHVKSLKLYILIGCKISRKLSFSVGVGTNQDTFVISAVSRYQCYIDSFWNEIYIFSGLNLFCFQDNVDPLYLKLIYLEASPHYTSNYNHLSEHLMHDCTTKDICSLHNR